MYLQYFTYTSKIIVESFLGKYTDFHIHIPKPTTGPADLPHHPGGVEYPLTDAVQDSFLHSSPNIRRFIHR